jgi:hypothetical protein
MEGGTMLTRTDWKRWSHGLAVLALMIPLLWTVACSGENKDSQSKLDITGTYVDEFGTTQTITQSAWSDSFGDVFHILSYSNFQRYLIAQNDAANAFNPSLYSRFDWTMFSSDLYYCQSAFAAVDFDTALAASADPANPPVSGCGGFAWTNLTP